MNKIGVRCRLIFLGTDAKATSTPIQFAKWCFREPAVKKSPQLEFLNAGKPISGPREKLRHLRLDTTSTCDNFAHPIWHETDFRDFLDTADRDFMTMIQCGFPAKKTLARIDEYQEMRLPHCCNEIIDIPIHSNLALMLSKGGRLPNEITYTF